MNNVFDINRFGKVLGFDAKKYFHNFGLTLAILCAIPIFMWVLTLVFEFTLLAPIRAGIIYLCTTIAIIIGPAKAFGDINLKREGVRFAMLPASTFEKFLSYTICCLFTIVIVLLGSHAIDSLLTVLPFGGFEKYIQNFSIMDNIKMLLNDTVGFFSDEDLTEAEAASAFELMQNIGRATDVSNIVGLLFTTGLFMLGNLFFQTHKTAKTIVVMLVVSFVISNIVQIILISSGDPISSYIIAESDEPDFVGISALVKRVTIIPIIINAVLTIGIYIGNYFKMKSLKY